MDAHSSALAGSSSDSNGAAKSGALTALTFQEAIARLQQYWASVGCAVTLPFNSEARSLPFLAPIRIKGGRLA